MDRLRKIVLAGAGVLFLIWVLFHFKHLTGNQNGFVRFVLGTVFAGMILFRGKSGRSLGVRPSAFLEDSQSRGQTPSRFNIEGGESYSGRLGMLSLAFAVCGLLSVIGGIVFGVNQFEWLGLVLVFGGCLLWALPVYYSNDIFLSLLLFYWIHPLPSQVFDPFQLMMQRWSVLGSEWFLHVVNTRVWADGLVLRTGFRVFDVPAACSGMATAVTVLLCALAVGILFRFRWHHLFIFVVVGIVQVLFLNIVRISMMVLLSARMAKTWAATYLHDSMGLFLLASVFLLVLEAVMLRVRKVKKLRERRDVEEARLDGTIMLTTHSRAVDLARRLVRVFLLIVLVGGLVAFAFFRRRPLHRGMMIAGIVDGLTVVNIEAADRASAEAVRLLPDDLELRVLRVQILIKRRKFEQALKEVKFVPVTEQQPVGLILEALGLLGMNKPDEAEALIRKLPDYALDHPEVALLRAELASVRKDTAGVVENVAKAARSGAVIERVRNLFSYLAEVERWDVISDCGSDVPHVNAVQALLAIRAHVEMGQVRAAGLILEDAVKKWSDEPAFLGYIAMMAAAGPGGKWEDMFVTRLKGALGQLDADKLALCIDTGFRLKRPDIAWTVYRRLQEVDARDPALFLSVAEYGDAWFVFRRRAVGMTVGGQDDTIDMTDHYLKRGDISSIPLARELSGPGTVKKRGEYLRKCLDELDRRREEDSLSERMMMMYPRALRLAGNYQEAHARLAEMARKYPAKSELVNRERAELYEQVGDWENVYEILREGLNARDVPVLSGLLKQARALLRLNMPAYAFELTDRALPGFPDSADIRFVMADIWRGLGHYEEALFALYVNGRYLTTRVVADLFLETGRLTEAELARRVMGLGSEKKYAPQEVMVPRAEYAIEGKWPPAFSKEEMAGESARLARDARAATSPYIRGLRQLEADWHGGGGEEADPGKWEAVGRDDLERAMALYKCALLMGRQGHVKKAREAVERGLELCPGSRFLWRLLIVFSDGDSDVVARARERCPADPEIWLAALVADGSGRTATGRMEDEIEAAIKEKSFSVGTMVRAGGFLLRKGFHEQAEVVARDAMRRARGFLPAYMLGLRCALALDKREWASSCAIRAASYARDPIPYYEIVAKIRSSNRGQDEVMALVAERLLSVSPGNVALVVRLADIYLEGDDPKRAFSVLVPLVNNGTRETGVSAFLLAAEAARRIDRLDQTIVIMDKARKLFPSNKVVLNNMVYYLALDKRTLPRAEKLLPELLEKWGNAFAVLDTAAVVYRNAGDFEKAKEYLEKAKTAVEKANPEWLRMNSKAMDLDVYLGKRDEQLDSGLDQFEKFKRSARRDVLVPLAKEIEIKRRSR